jgi:predicted negative regulator of RcsB-dependent stress response
MMVEYSNGKAEAAETLGARLLKDFTDTPYAGKAALYLARISHDRNDSTSARQQLQWALDKAVEPATAHAARLRLARLALSQNAHDEVGALLKVPDHGGFQSQYRELEGDMQLAQGRAEDAERSYRAALDSLSAGSAYADVLRMKIDHAAGGRK